VFDPARHEPLADIRWSESRARDAIGAICRGLEATFDRERLWPLDPVDQEPETAEVVRGLYLGAAGMLHGLHRLAEFYEPRLDARAILEDLHPEPDEEDAGASLLVGSSGFLLVAHGFGATTADALADAIAANAEHPSNELLLGAPGTMLAARAMHARTGEKRFAELWRESARTLLARQETDGLWTQDLYGKRRRFLGAGHGFAGNIHALLAAPEWLDDAEAVMTNAATTARATANVDGDGANWPPQPDEPPSRVQWCHGAPGVITSLAGADGADDLLAAAGELTWRAGPLAHNPGLCHGTGGNGFALLALHARTGDELWLERARAFAMHALPQTSGRASLFLGDLGAALLAGACIDGDARFPGLDDLGEASP
jgi:Lanthionine synthetase C-like protein